MRRVSSLVLVLLLLLGQATLFAHEYDFSVHKEGASCSVCLHATPLTHAAVGTFSLLLPRADSSVELHLIERPLILIADSLYRARAPPISPSL